MTLRIAIHLLLSLPLLLACGDDFRDPAEIQRLEVRDWFPGNDAFVARDAGVGASLTFNRPLSRLSDIKLALAPRATTGDLVLSPSRRNITLLEVVPGPATRVQFVLVDSRNMTRPFVMYWRTEPDAAAVETSGVVRSADPRGRPASSAVVFAMHSTSGFNPLDLGTFTRSEPSAMAVGIPIPEDPDAAVVLPLPLNSGVYLVVAILDTNRDLIYDPTEDWSGVYRDRTGEPLTVTPGTKGFLVSIGPP